MLRHNPDNKVHGANMGPIWGRQDPGGPHVGSVNFAFWECIHEGHGYVLLYYVFSWNQKYLYYHIITVMLHLYCIYRKDHYRGHTKSVVNYLKISHQEFINKCI